MEGTAPQESPQKDYNAWMREEMEKEPDTGPLIVGMTCIYVPVSNVFESVEWYRENLGCEPTHHNPVRPGMAKAIMRFPDYERTKAPAILLVQARDCAGMLEFADDDGNSSAVACLVAPRLQEVHDRLKKNGVVVEGGPGDERVSASSVKFHDPDGNQWEVWQP